MTCQIKMTQWWQLLSWPFVFSLIVIWFQLYRKYIYKYPISFIFISATFAVRSSLRAMVQIKISNAIKYNTDALWILYCWIGTYVRCTRICVYISLLRVCVFVSRHTNFQSYVLNLASNCGEYKCFNYFQKWLRCCCVYVCVFLCALHLKLKWEKHT